MSPCEMVAAPEKSEVSEKSAASEEDQAYDAFEESAQEGRAMTTLLGVNAGASEVSEKSVATGLCDQEALGKAQ